MTAKALFVATGNRHKVGEIIAILGELVPDWHVYSLLDYPSWEREVEECGRTYRDNAYLKALAYLDNPEHLPTLADDSGLEVAAFPGLLGVRSSRWCAGSMERKCEVLFEKMRGVSDRRMTFYTTFCYLAPGAAPEFFESFLTGRAAEQLADVDGFDYDPIFIPDGFDLTYGQLGQPTKNRISQRRRALEQLAAFLRSPAGAPET